jgi:hypothetical protein
MMSTDRALERRLRLSYELGRARFGLRALWLLVPIVACAVALGQPARMALSLGALLFVLSAGLRWRGGVMGRGASVGLVAAAAPLLLPFAVRSLGHCCVGGACMSWCLAGCVGGGAIAGACIGFASLAERDQRWSFLLAATLISGLGGMLGCSVAGLSGTLGMALALGVSALPICWVAKPA